MRKEWRNEGSITILVALIFMSILLLLGSLLGGARVELIKSQAASAASSCQEAFRADYCRELFEDYGVILYYGSQEKMQGLMEEHVRENLPSKGMLKLSLQSVQVSADSALEDNGEAFYEEVLRMAKKEVTKEAVEGLFTEYGQMEEGEGNLDLEKVLDGQEDLEETLNSTENCDKALKKLQKIHKKFLKKGKLKKYQEKVKEALLAAKEEIENFQISISQARKEGAQVFVESGEESYLDANLRIIESALANLGSLWEKDGKIYYDQSLYPLDQLIIMGGKKEKHPSVIKKVKNLLLEGKLSLVLDSGETISGKEIFGDLPSANYVKEKDRKTMDKLYYSFYVRNHFSSYVKEGKNAMKYGQEYLLIGKKTDLENLSATIDRLVLFREPFNLANLLSDEEKISICQNEAILLMGWTGIPILVSLTKAGIIAAWTIWESIYDVKCLCKGERVPLRKSKQEWKTDFGTIGKRSVKVKEESKGLSYEDYLQFLIYLQNVKLTNLRTMDLIQMTMEETYDSSFCFQKCYAKGELKFSYEIPLYTNQIVMPHVFTEKRKFQE